MRILYVEDNVGFRRDAVARHLHDCDVVELATVHAALLFLAQPGAVEALDLALLDYELPDGTGHEVLVALRERSPELRILGVSADGRYNQILLDAGANGALRKSRFEHLRATIGL